ncbi:methyltransferase family protein [Salinispira pacifica]|nr:isoprenylcysteine carboxylmethyltransferase family protein [Salinispira pacifica]
MDRDHPVHHRAVRTGERFAPGAGAAAGAVLFVLGSFINSWSEYQRKRFKAKPENGGRLYTGGLFSVSMHINYFGDMIWATGLALMTGSLISAAIPVIMTAMFVWIHIPRLDAYLAEKYGREFEDYASRTKKLIPWMY